jgi:benzoyl-CoA 2,3-dioxygenase component B
MSRSTALQVLISRWVSRGRDPARESYNVGLAEKPALRKSLEWFGVEFRKWWFDCGPAGIRDNEVYLRTPVGVDAGGWAQYGFVPLSQYRWGVFQAPAKPGRLALFGDIAGQPVWQALPQAHRDYVRKLLITQGDTERVRSSRAGNSRSPLRPSTI